MAFNRTLLVPVYVSTDAPGALLAIQASSVTNLNIEEKVDSNNITYCTKKPFVWKGNFYIPYGNQFNSIYQYVGYHAGKYTGLLGWDNNAGQIIPFGDKVVFWGYSDYGYGRSPFKMDTYVGATGNQYVRSWAILGDKVFIANWGNIVWIYQYPFNLTANNVSQKIIFLCAFKGDMYGLDIDSNRYLQLWKWNGATFVQVGSDHDTTTSALQENAYSNGFFEFNGKLHVVCQQSLGNTRIRCWEVDESTGVFTEKASDVPTAMKTNAPSNNGPINVVIDDIGSSRQVFLLIYTLSTQPGGWSLYEFADGSEWTLINQGAQKFGPYCHILWDEESTGANIIGATQDPAGHVDMDVHTADLKYNSAADIDPRYADADSSSDAPPYNSCTEQTGVGSEGKTGLSTKPTGITLLANLSDDWADGTIDEDLWEVINYGIYNTNFARDHGIGYGYTFCDIDPTEASGYLRFPPSTKHPSQIGAGLMSKWLIQGAFSAEISLIGLSQLYQHNTEYVKLVLYAKISEHKGYGIFVWRNGSGVVKAKSFCFQQDVSPAHFSVASTHTVVDGEKMKVSRDGSDVWSAVIDPDGDNESLDPGYAPGYSDPVQLYFLIMNHGSLSPSTGSPGPGFGPLTVSGAGSIGKYLGAVEHQFSWDAVGDLGAGFIGTANLFVDTVS